VHIFYYPWYSNPTDNRELGWNHWNHNIIPHWVEEIRKKYPHDVKYPGSGDDIGSVYYPKRGLYYSGNEMLLDDHMKELKDYLVVVSWWGRDSKDGEGMSTDKLMHSIFKSAEKFGTKISFHLEPYEGRTIESIKADLIYIHQNYGSYSSFYRDPLKNRSIMYIYDSYLIQSLLWQDLLLPSGKHTIRNTPYDTTLIGLYLDPTSETFFDGSGFDGIYTYFAAEGFTQGSTPQNWDSLVIWAHRNAMTISISVGPGYDDTRIRPWNEKNKKKQIWRTLL
jgi:glycoprotein endo-alpha-1,2-mannosidase